MNLFQYLKKNGMIVKDVDYIPKAIAFYLENLKNWNEAVVNSYEIGKKYNCRFASTLIIAVLEELDDICKEMKKNADEEI